MAARIRRTGAAVVAALVVLVGCSADQDPGLQPAPSTSTSASTSTSSTPAPSSSSTEPGAYVAVGASETVGVGADDPATQAWPQVLHDTALPGSRFVNVGVSGGTVEGALRTQLPAALAAEPDVATVWLAVNDLIAAVPVPAYQRRLDRLVRALRRDGRTQVLVGNVPDLWRLPAYRACLPGARGDRPCLLPFVPPKSEVRAQVRAYNAAIRWVVRREGARLVDLSGIGLTGLTSADGFHPSTAGHQRVARAFARALRR